MKNVFRHFPSLCRCDPCPFDRHYPFSSGSFGHALKSLRMLKIRDFFVYDGGLVGVRLLKGLYLGCFGSLYDGRHDYDVLENYVWSSPLLQIPALLAWSPQDDLMYPVDFGWR